jgi:hypothetical protein
MRGIHTSRAFWELKADQVLNRVFEAETAAATAIEVEVLERPLERPPAPPTPERSMRSQLGAQPGLVLTGIGVTALIAASGGLLLVGLWSQSQQALRQERSLLLLERLRHLGPAAAEPATASSDGLPPPPPAEPWMQELASLPSGGAPAAEPLQVPVSERITSPPPAAASGGSTPQLVGVVQVPGRAGSAIFQLGGSSTSAGVGESIGGSGWRLVSASGESAVIERGGEQRRLSISGGF